MAFRHTTSKKGMTLGEKMLDCGKLFSIMFCLFDSPGGAPTQEDLIQLNSDYERSCSNSYTLLRLIISKVWICRKQINPRTPFFRQYFLEKQTLCLSAEKLLCQLVGGAFLNVWKNLYVFPSHTGKTFQARLLSDIFSSQTKLSKPQHFLAYHHYPGIFCHIGDNPKYHLFIPWSGFTQFILFLNW